MWRASAASRHVIPVPLRLGFVLPPIAHPGKQRHREARCLPDEHWAAPGFLRRAAVPEPVLSRETRLSELLGAAAPPRSISSSTPPPPPMGAAAWSVGICAWAPHTQALLRSPPGTASSLLSGLCSAAQVDVSRWGPCTQDLLDRKLPPPPANKTLPQPKRCESSHTPGRSPSDTDSVHQPRSLGPHESHTPTVRIQIPRRLRARSTPVTQRPFPPCPPKHSHAHPPGFGGWPGAPDSSRRLRSLDRREPAAERGSDADGATALFPL